ncbi:DNA-lyase [Phyllosticta citricarpa]
MFTIARALHRRLLLPRIFPYATSGSIIHPTVSAPIASMADCSRQARSAASTTRKRGAEHDDDDNAAAAKEPVKRTKRATRGAAKANYAEESADDEQPDAKVDTKESAAPKKSAKGRQSKTAEPAAPFAERTVGHSFKIGAHVSASGEISNGLGSGNAFALFLKNQRRWTNAPLKEENAIMFKAACKEHKYESEKDVVPHGSYLVNLAHVDPERTQQAYESFLDDVSRCHQLGIKLYNFHPGNAASSTRDEALKQLASNLNRVHADPSTGSVITLLETMAVFTGNTIGGTFEELRAIIDQISDKTRVGVCLDTCHVFAAGYDLRTPDAFSAVLDKFDQVIGLDYLKALHLNDSKAPLSSGRDLHANIGTGFLGLRAFHALMNEPRLRGLPMVLETPIDVPDPKNPGKTTEDRAVWAREIKLLESLVGMDAESDAFVQLEAELQERGRSERERVQAQVDKREEKKGGKQTKLSFGRVKKKKKGEEDGGEGSEEE